MSNSHKAIGDLREESAGVNYPLAVVGVGEKFHVVDLTESVDDQVEAQRFFGIEFPTAAAAYAGVRA